MNVFEVPSRKEDDFTPKLPVNGLVEDSGHVSEKEEGAAEEWNGSAADDEVVRCGMYLFLENATRALTKNTL